MLYCIYDWFSAMKSSTKQASQGQIVSALISVCVIVGATGFAWYWMQKQALPQEETQTQNSPTAEQIIPPTPTPTPTKLLHGKETYSVSGGGGAGPGISEITFDPLDPAVGSTQVITVKASDTSGVSSVLVNVRTDTKTTSVVLKRITGTELSGAWEATWTVPETYLYNYIPTIVAKSNAGETKIPVTIRERK